MVMAHLFLAAGIPCALAHCNFGLRAAESDKDEQLVRDWCAANNVPLHTVRFDTKQKTAEWKKGTQETARILRYEWFEEVRKANGYAKIATAHHADDNVETLLINLFKGTGISGLHGILPVNGHIIRPLLFAKKEDITAYAAAHAVPFRKDASNDTDDYLRNAVRHNIVPVADKWFPNVVGHVSDSIARFAEAEILYRKALDREQKKMIEQRGNDYYIPVLKLQKSEVKATLVYEVLLPFGFTPGQVPHVLSLLTAESGHYISSATHRIIRNRNFLVITTVPTESADMLLVEGLPCTIDTAKHRYTFSLQPMPATITGDKETAWIDMTGVEFPLVLRKWRTGDYFYPFGMKMKKKKVSRLMVDEKVPLHEKENIRILECGKRIAWVSGLRSDERFRVRDTTEKVLVVKRRLL